MEINKLAQEIHAVNVKNGFYDNPVEFGTSLMLVTSELAEALEADRKGKHPNLFDFNQYIRSGFTREANTDTMASAFKRHVKDTVQDEIADAIIRLLDISEHMGFDMEFHIRQKLEYNKTREKMHGKKY